MTQLEQVKAALETYSISGLKNEVAPDSGVNYATLIRIRNGFDNPGYKTVETLFDFLKRRKRIKVEMPQKTRRNNRAMKK